MALYDIVEQFFTGDEWYFVRMDGQTMLQTTYNGKNGRWPCFAQTNETQFLFFFYSISPVNIPENRRAAMSEYLTLANYGLKVGNFEFNFESGEVRYKTSIDVEKAELTQPLVSNLVYANVWTMDRYIPGIFSVSYGSQTPGEAIAAIEGRT